LPKSKPIFVDQGELFDSLEEANQWLVEMMQSGEVKEVKRIYRSNDGKILIHCVRKFATLG
jgi:hypothetical protein